MLLGFTYDLRIDYLAAGYGKEETAEFDQVGTIDAIDDALRELGHTVDRIGNARSLVERLGQGDRWDLVFNICEGLHGCARESQVPAILDVYGIPYTFSNPAILAVCLDKALTKTVAHAAGVPTPEWHVVRKLKNLDSFNLPFPVIAKPLAEGTGKGIDATSKITDIATLRATCERLLDRYHEPVLVEAFLAGREFTVGILGSSHACEVIGTLEIILRHDAEQNVYSYANKENSEELVDCCLVSAGDDATVAETEQTALAAWRAVGGYDAGRVDIRCNELGNSQLIEINPIAGLHPTHSDLPTLWTAVGRKYVELIGSIVESACSRRSIKERAKVAFCPNPRF